MTTENTELLSPEQLEAIVNESREWLRSLFDGSNVDLFELACTLTRAGSNQGPQSDPVEETRAIAADLAKLRSLDLVSLGFEQSELTRWRLRMMGYAQLVEMDAPYHVLANLLRLKSAQPYTAYPFTSIKTNPNPNKADKKKENKQPAPPNVSAKLDQLDALARKANIRPPKELFQRFYFNELRNAFQHADFALNVERFYMRSGAVPRRDISIGVGTILDPEVDLRRLDEIVSLAERFYEAFFATELEARRAFTRFMGKPIKIDGRFKGKLTFLYDDNDLLCGWTIDSPSGRQSMFRRGEDGCDAINIWAPDGRIDPAPTMIPIGF
jgi:hypothetical protein